MAFRRYDVGASWVGAATEEAPMHRIPQYGPPSRAGAWLALGAAMAMTVAACDTAGTADTTDGARPTSGDQALVRRLERAVASARPLRQAREPILLVEAERTQRKIDRLTGTRAADAAQLRRARRSVESLTRTLEAAHQWRAAPIHPIARRRSGLTIDGHIDEPAWRRAKPMPLRYDARITHDAEPPFAEARLLWDETHLYAAFDVPDPAIRAPAMQRDDKVFTADCVELFMMPHISTGRYWELNVSPTGAVLDQLARKHKDAPLSDFSKSSNITGLRYASHIRGTANEADDTDEGYTVEIAVPWHALPDMASPPSAGQRLWLLTARADRTASGALRFYAHAQVVGSFHNIWTWPRVELVENIDERDDRENAAAPATRPGT